MMTERLFNFVGGKTGAWRVVRMRTLSGSPIEQVDCVDVVSGSSPCPPDAGWLLRGITSNERYVTQPEKQSLVARQEGLGRTQATCAALIPLRKNAAWWSLTQDQRREIFEEQSQHIRIGLKALPAVARRLHHCRDLGSDEPFDFLTWFEFAPTDAILFEQLLDELRVSPEWSYIDREVDIRLVRAR